MKAIILAAGLGRRMQPLSDSCHKALLPIGDKTILGRIVDSLLGIGVRDIVIVTGHLAEDIRTYCAVRYPDVPFVFLHNERFETTNNIVSLSLALDRTNLDTDVLLIECDLLFEPSLLRRLADRRSGNVALVDRYRSGMDGTVVSVGDGIITQVFPPHLQGRDFAYHDKFKTLNIYRFDREFCRKTLQPLLSCYANLIDGNCYYELVLGMLVNMQRERIEAEVVHGTSWSEVDDPNDLTVARFDFEPERRVEILDRALGGHWSLGFTDFAFMANAYFPTDAMMAAMRQALPQLLRSYGSTQRVLNEKLGFVRRCRPERVQVLHGATQFFPMMTELFGSRPALVPEPTFGEYRRVFPGTATYADAPGYDLDEVASRLEPGGMLVVVNPNNPTGTTLRTDAIFALAARRPDALVFVDESFIEFSDQPSLVDRLEREPLPNVVVLVSMSKSLGVPGLRLGFVYSADHAVIARVGERIPIWNLSAPAEWFLEVLLKFRNEWETSLRRTIEDREAFALGLARSSMVDRVYPSGGNFLLVRLVGSDPTLGVRIRRRLLAEHRIEIKDVSSRMGTGHAYVRLAVRQPDDNARLLSALESISAGSSEAHA